MCVKLCVHSAGGIDYICYWGNILDSVCVCVRARFLHVLVCEVFCSRIVAYIYNLPDTTASLFAVVSRSNLI